MALTLSAHCPADRAEEIPTPEDLLFLEQLHQRFACTRGDLLSGDCTDFLTIPAHELAG